MSLFEHFLHGICEHIQKSQGYVQGARDMKGMGTKPAQTYLKTICGVPFPDDNDRDWVELKKYSLLRNVFIHRRGRFRAGDEELLAFIRSKGEFAGTTRFNEITLTHHFCIEAIEKVRSFCIRVLDLIPEELFEKKDLRTPKT